MRARARERRALEERLDEELRVEVRRRRVERAPVDRGVDVVLRGDGVRHEQVDDLGGAEARVAHPAQDLVRRVLRERDEPVDRGDGVVRAAREELEPRAAEAVADRDRAGELDAAEERVR